MARLFDDGANEYLQVTSTPVTAPPYTLATWARSDDAGILQAVIGIGAAGTADMAMITMRGTIGGDPVSFTIYDGTIDHCDTTTGYSANVWHHICAVAKANNDRAIYIDGGSKGTDNTAITPANLVTIRIGQKPSASVGWYFSGRVAEAVILRIAATDYQVWLHAQGVPAPMVWPGWAIVAYYPLFETDRDFPVGNYNMTPFNTPSWAPHPPKVLAWYRKYMRGGTA